MAIYWVSSIRDATLTEPDDQADLTPNRLGYKGENKVDNVRVGWSSIACFSPAIFWGISWYIAIGIVLLRRHYSILGPQLFFY